MPRFPCLSIRQPFVEEIFRGLKKIEYRSWHVDFTGLLAIHASTSREELDDMPAAEFHALFPTGDDRFHLGFVVGIVVLDRCDDGAWHLKNPRRLLKPFRTKASAAIFYVDIPAEHLPDDIKQEIGLEASSIPRIEKE